MADQGSKTLRRTLFELSGGLLLGVVGASLLGPSAISWWYQPPSKDAFSCAGSVEKALSQFVLLQLTCAAAGAVLLWLLLFAIRRVWRGRQSASPTR